MNANNLKARIATALTAAALLFGSSTLRADEDPLVLLARSGVDTTRVRVVQTEGITIVRGSVPNAADASETSQVLKNAGYRRVANLLTVAPPPTDESLRREVERALTRTRSLDGTRLVVGVAEGTVTIDGTVRRDLQRQAASDIVRDVRGVKNVVNRLVREERL